MSRSILVLGIPRSGTSCVAGVLRRLGVDMGSGHLQPPDEHNPKGYYEDLRWQKFNKRVTGLGYGIKRPATIEGSLKARYKLLAKQRQGRGWIWGIKDPRLCVTAQFIWPFLEDARMVVVSRNQKHCAVSIQRHSRTAYRGQQEMTFKQAWDYIHKYAMALQHAASMFTGPIHDVDYETLIDEQHGQVTALEAFCFEGLDTMPTYGEFNDARTWIDRSMNHG